MNTLIERFRYGATLALLVGITMSLTACDDDENLVAEVEASTIVDVASDNGFATLVTAVQAAELEETLQGDGPFTVFAPTDEAFAKLPDGTVESLLRPENKELLVSILTYHVVPGEVKSDQVVKLSKANTVEGSEVEFSVVDGTVKVNDATVIAADIPATNGVIHVIDTVLLPPTDDNVN